MSESSQKLDLLRKSLELRRQELPANSPAAAQLKQELQSVQAASPIPVTYTSLHTNTLQRPSAGGSGDHHHRSLHSSAFISRSAAVTGKLEVRLMGCQDLLEDVPGRSRRDKDQASSPSDLKSFVKGTSNHPRESTCHKL